MQMHKLVKTIVVSSVLALAAASPVAVQVAVAQAQVTLQTLPLALQQAYGRLPPAQQARMLANLSALTPAQLQAVVSLPPAQATAVATLRVEQVRAITSLPAPQIAQIAQAVVAVETAANADAAAAATTALARALPATLREAVTVGVAANVAELADAGIIDKVVASNVLTTTVAVLELPQTDTRAVALTRGAEALADNRTTDGAIGDLGNDASQAG